MARDLTQIVEEIVEQVSYFVRNYMIPIIQEFFYSLSKIIDILVDMMSTKDHSYKAEFSTYNDILSSHNKGYCVDGRQCLDSNAQNMMIIGGSGYGKTTVVVAPTIFKADSNFIINDPSHEIAKLTSGYLQSIGYDIKYINFSDATMGNGYNPMHRIKTTADANKIAHLLVRSVMGHQVNDPFWTIQSVAIISLIIKLLLFQDKKYQNFANVRLLVQMLSTNTKMIDGLIARTGSEELINDYKSFLSFDVKLRTSIQSTALASLNIFSDPVIAKVTSIDTLNFDIDTFRKTKQAIYIHCNTADVKYYSVLISIFVEQISKEIMSKLPDKNEVNRKAIFVLDELSSLYLPSLDILISNLRKYYCSIMCILQSYTQLIDIYGTEQASSIRMNCYAKLYFTGLDHYTASEISNQLGKYEYYENETNKKHIRELLTPSEVRMLPRDKAILICSNYSPIKLTLTPYYKNPFLKLRAQIPEPPLKGVLDETPVELITEEA